MSTGHLTPLVALLQTQERDNDVVGYPQIQHYAQQVIDWANQFDEPLLIPVGPTAHRLLGAATLMAHGSLDTAVWTHRLDGRTILLVGTVTASVIEFEAAAANAKRRGATHIHGCAIEISNHATAQQIDSMTLLEPHRAQIRRSA